MLEKIRAKFKTITALLKVSNEQKFKPWTTTKTIGEGEGGSAAQSEESSAKPSLNF
jgi:hypothetical protein